MTSFVISYDLNKPKQNYKDLHDAIKNLGTWWHCLDSTWFIKSGLDSKTIRDRLSTQIDNDDDLIVARLTGEAAWSGFPDPNCSDWLKKNM